MTANPSTLTNNKAFPLSIFLVLFLALIMLPSDNDKETRPILNHQYFSFHNKCISTAKLESLCYLSSWIKVSKST